MDRVLITLYEALTMSNGIRWSTSMRKWAGAPIEPARLRSALGEHR